MYEPYTVAERLGFAQTSFVLCWRVRWFSCVIVLNKLQLSAPNYSVWNEPEVVSMTMFKETTILQLDVRLMTALQVLQVQLCQFGKVFVELKSHF